MNTLKIHYNTSSEIAQTRRNRLQLLSASFSIIIGYWESFGFYTRYTLVLPVLGFVIAFINILFARYYKQLINKFGDKFENLLLRIDGVIMLITGIGYHLAGSKDIQYAYYFLALIFFVALPHFLYPAKKKRLLIELTNSTFSYRGLFRKVAILWTEIESIGFHKNVLQLKLYSKKKAVKFYLEKEKMETLQLPELVKNIKRENNFDFEMVVS